MHHVVIHAPLLYGFEFGGLRLLLTHLPTSFLRRSGMAQDLISSASNPSLNKTTLHEWMALSKRNVYIYIYINTDKAAGHRRASSSIKVQTALLQSSDFPGGVPVSSSSSSCHYLVIGE